MIEDVNKWLDEDPGVAVENIPALLVALDDLSSRLEELKKAKNDLVYELGRLKSIRYQLGKDELEARLDSITEKMFNLDKDINRIEVETILTIEHYENESPVKQ